MYQDYLALYIVKLFYSYNNDADKWSESILIFWLWCCNFLSFLKLLNLKIVCNPDGMEWRRPIISLRKLFKICEKIFAKTKIAKVYDSEVIKRYYKVKYKSDGKTIYYPSKFEDYKISVRRSNKIKRFYILGRLLEENNVSLIVDTFKKLDDYKLFIIGYKSKFFKKIILPSIKDSKNIFYVGEIYNKKELFNYLSFFDYYIHGHKVWDKSYFD